MNRELDLKALASIPDPISVRPGPTPGPPPAPAAVAGPTRSALRRRRAIVIVFSVAWLLAIQLVIGVRHDVPTAIMALHVGVPAILGAASLWLALEPGRIGLGPTLKTIGAFSAISIAAFAVAALSGPLLGDAAVVSNEQGPFFEGIFFCGDFILGAALVPLLALVWAQRRTDVVGSGVRSTLLGLSVGFTAAGVQALHCAHSDGPHVLLGHGWPIVVMALVGLLALRRAVRA